MRNILLFTLGSLPTDAVFDQDHKGRPQCHYSSQIYTHILAPLNWSTQALPEGVDRRNELIGFKVTIATATIERFGNVVSNQGAKVSSLVDVVFYRDITMQDAVEQDPQNRSNYMCAVNPSRISKTFSARSSK